MSWRIDDAIANASWSSDDLHGVPFRWYNAVNASVCLAVGTHTITLFDSRGAGWLSGSSVRIDADDGSGATVLAPTALESGYERTVSFWVGGLPPSPPMPPAFPPLSPGTFLVSTFDQLRSAVQDLTVIDIALAPGHYAVTSPLYITGARTVTIRSLLPLAAELDANYAGHVLVIQTTNVHLDGLWLRRAVHGARANGVAFRKNRG